MYVCCMLYVVCCMLYVVYSRLAVVVVYHKPMKRAEMRRMTMMGMGKGRENPKGKGTDTHEAKKGEGGD